MMISEGEAEFWRQTQDIIHLIGICGSGKTTLAHQLADRCTRYGGRAISTIDYDPHISDHERSEERAFNRELDRLNSEAKGRDPLIHQQIVARSLQQIVAWKQSHANIVLVDRWYESYDGLPECCMDQIEAAIQDSGFRLCRILLVVAEDLSAYGECEIRRRLLHTKEHRPESWWKTGPDSLNQWVREECDYQEQYRQFCRNRSKGVHLLMTLTTKMEWNDYENRIVDSLIYGRPVTEGQI